MRHLYPNKSSNLFGGGSSTGNSCIMNCQNKFTDPICKTIAKSSRKTFAGIALLLMFCFANQALAQPEVALEFEKSLGKFGFYERENFEPNSIPPTGFNVPSGVDWLTGTRFVVADKNNNKLQTCDDQGECAWVGNDSSFGRNSPGTFDLPHGVEVNNAGKIAVADEDNHAIQLCTELGSCTYKGDSSSNTNNPSSQLGRWAFPNDVAFDSDGNIHGLDTGNNRVQILRSSDLFLLDVYMSSGSAAGQLNGAKGIAIDKDDRIIIADTGNNRIQICNTEPSCSMFGSSGSAVGQFNAPSGVDVDALGRIWVADSGNNRIQVCDYSGNCVAFGEAGTGDFQFDDPRDVAIHVSGRVAVVDSGNHRIQLFNTESSFAINAGMNDAWYNEDTDGQGFFITVFPDLGVVSLAWFTYDTALPPANAIANLGDAGHRWLTALGPISGAQSVMNIDIASGGIFDTKTDISHRSDGTITLTFSDCNAGTVEYNIPSINQQGTVEITRVVGDNIELCRTLQ